VPLPLVLTALLFAAGCASITGDRETVPVRAADFTPAEIRQTTVLIRLGLPNLDDRRRSSFTADYEGALLDALNARAVIVKDTRVLGERDRATDTTAALARARDLDAGALIVVDARMTSRRLSVCEDSERPRRIESAVLAQRVEVLRAGDGATRLRIVEGLDVPVVQVDCEAGRARRRTMPETFSEAAERIVRGLLGPWPQPGSAMLPSFSRLRMAVTSRPSASVTSNSSAMPASMRSCTSASRSWPAGGSWCDFQRMTK